MKKISCVIPAYNEAARIGHVLDLALSCPLIDEVIVVNDGSSDNTEKVIRSFSGARIISFEKNGGKSRAVQSGISAAEGEYIMLLDADLIGLTAEDLTALIRPILDGEADMSISLRKGTAPLWYLLGIDYLSGERIFPRNLLDKASLEAFALLPAFWLEVFLNQLVIAKHLRVRVVRWKAVQSPLKWSKRGFFRGLWGEILMRVDIYKTIGTTQVFSQNIQLLKLRSPNTFDRMGQWQKSFHKAP